MESTTESTKSEVTSRSASRLRGFDSGAREIDDAPVRVVGELPPWLRGTLLLNGPALWELPGGSLRHWFDGYGMWHAVHLADGGARYRSRFARSESYERSVQAGRPAFGEFGTANPAGFLTRLRAPQITDNPAVVMSRWGEGWISVTETPYATRFDPRTLATVGRVALAQPGEAMHLMSAHGTTLADGSYLNVAIELGPRCTLKPFRLAPGSRAPEILARIRTPKAGYTHGTALAPGWLIFWETALRAQALAFRFGARSYADNFRWEPQAGSAIHAISLEDGSVRTWCIPPMMCFHATQAFTDGENLVLDLAVYDDGIVFDDLMLEHRRRGAAMRAMPEHRRYRLRRGRSDAEPEPLPGRGLELQQVNPGRWGRSEASVCWAAGFGPAGQFNDRTLRIDLERGDVLTWQRPDAVQLEPQMLARPGSNLEDDGVLLVPTLADGDATTIVAVVDAATMELRAELHLPQVVPFGFHAAFDG